MEGKAQIQGENHWLTNIYNLYVAETKYPLTKEECYLFLGQGVSFEELRYLGIIKANPEASYSRIAELLGRNRDTVRKRIKALRDRGYVRKEESGILVVPLSSPYLYEIYRKDCIFPLEEKEFYILLEKGLSFEMLRFLGLLKANPNLTLKQMAVMTGKYHDTMKRWVKQLKDMGIIERNSKKQLVLKEYNQNGQ